MHADLIALVVSLFNVVFLSWLPHHYIAFFLLCKSCFHRSLCSLCCWRIHIIRLLCCCSQTDLFSCHCVVQVVMHIAHYHAVVLSFCVVILLWSFCVVIMLFCHAYYHVIIRFTCHAVQLVPLSYYTCMMSLWQAVIMSCCHVVALLCCHFVLLSCRGYCVE